MPMPRTRYPPIHCSLVEKHFYHIHKLLTLFQHKNNSFSLTTTPVSLMQEASSWPPLNQLIVLLAIHTASPDWTMSVDSFARAFELQKRHSPSQHLKLMAQNRKITSTQLLWIRLFLSHFFFIIHIRFFISQINIFSYVSFHFYVKSPVAITVTLHHNIQEMMEPYMFKKYLILISKYSLTS